MYGNPHPDDISHGAGLVAHLHELDHKPGSSGSPSPGSSVLIQVFSLPLSSKVVPQFVNANLVNITHLGLMNGGEISN